MLYPRCNKLNKGIYVLDSLSSSSYPERESWVLLVRGRRWNYRVRVPIVGPLSIPHASDPSSGFNSPQIFSSTPASMKSTKRRPLSLSN